MIIEEYLKANHPSLYEEEETDTDKIIETIIDINTNAKICLVQLLIKKEHPVKYKLEIQNLVRAITRQFTFIQNILKQSGLIKELDTRGSHNPVGKLLLEVPEGFIYKQLANYELKVHEIESIKHSIKDIYNSYCVSLYTRSEININLIINILESNYIIFGSDAETLFKELRKESI